MAAISTACGARRVAVALGCLTFVTACGEGDAGSARNGGAAGAGGNAASGGGDGNGPTGGTGGAVTPVCGDAHCDVRESCIACPDDCGACPSGPGIEKRCTELGPGCVCSEPLNTAAHDGGDMTWSSGFMNFDDSPTSTECWPSDHLQGGENYCDSGHDMVPAASQSAFLPPGHSLSFLFHQFGNGGICHVAHPGIIEMPGMTYCIRHYRRYDAATTWPADPNQQQKVATIGALQENTTDQILNAQISMSVDATIHTRFDGYLFDSPNDFQSLGDMESDCVNNFCRFEICFDYSAEPGEVGAGRVRLRKTRVAPGSGETTVFKPIGNMLQPNGLNSPSSGPAGMALYVQNIYAETYSTHFITTRVLPEDRNFWPGAACEVEGDCP